MLYQLNANQGSGRSSSLIEVENLVQTGNLTEVEVNDDTAEQEEFFELENEANSLKYIYWLLWYLDIFKFDGIWPLSQEYYNWARANLF